jgi:hypothetical protein
MQLYFAEALMGMLLVAGAVLLVVAPVWIWHRDAR